VHYRGNGATLAAIDYFNPDDSHAPENLKHLLFVRPQVFKFTPEEVHNVAEDEVPWGRGSFGSAGIASLGLSAWLKSFAPQHLSNCQHFRVMFYDQYLDIICERIDAKVGGYVDA
jgi:hypothetical protein